MPTSPVFYSDESSLETRSQDAIPSLLAETRRELAVTGHGGLTLAAEAYGDPDQQRAVILVQGRLESFIKYDEITDELLRNGYAVYRYDHRGQGLSPRLLTDPHKGYVDSYDAYVADLRAVIATVHQGTRHRHLFLLAHSMGGCISILTLATATDLPVRAVALCAPMLRVHSGRVPYVLARLIVWLSAAWHRLRHGKGESPYFRSGGPYRAKPFEGNHITHSPIRYRLFRARFAATPQAQLGDPTLDWVLRSLRAAGRAVKAAGKLHLPLLVLEAGADRVVSHQGIRRFCRRAPDCEHHVIDGARHELLFESDPYRRPAIGHILAFFERCCRSS